MGWSQDQINKFQMDNTLALKEVNDTLIPCDGIKDKIGIFAPGQIGDLGTAMSVLKYKDEIFPNKDIVWFVNFPNCDMLKYSNINEVRPYPWAGNGLPEGCENFHPMLCDENNKLRKDLAKNFELTKDLEDGYFPVTYMVDVSKRAGVEYPLVSKKVFGVPDEYEWHPFLCWSEDEKNGAFSFIEGLPKGRKNIMIEAFCGSGQSPYWDESTTKKIMALCREMLGECNFIFASHKHKGGVDNIGLDNELFFDEPGCVSAAKFTVRQCALLNEYCDLFIGMSSGISVSTSSWGLKPVIKLQYCGSKVCSTVPLSNSEIALVTTQYKQKEVADQEFYDTLIAILKSI